MATISTDTYLDGGTARTAGESWTINGPVFTVRTDTRWHANAPASMTGTLGQVSFSTSLGGTFRIDGRNVRWMPFDTGSGAVPAIGTTITQGGVSGYLLGVWADYTSAPTAVGAAMPATGYLKFREVTGGTFSAGALTGISANATSVDVVGWIEVVVDQGVNVAVNSSALSKNEILGVWFDLGTTTGTAGQVIQLPTNAGGSTTPAIAIQIETSPGSGTYEWYNGITENATYFATTTLATDARAKFVRSTTNGTFVIGKDSSNNNVGYVPASGCKIRVPNVFCRQAATASRATNALHATFTSRPRINLGTDAVVNIDKASIDWYLTTSTSGLTTIKNTAYESQMTFTSSNDTFTIEDSANGFVAALVGNAINLSSMFLGPQSYLTRLKLVNNSGVTLSIGTSYGITVTDCSASIVSNRGSSSTAISTNALCKNINFVNPKLMAGTIILSGSNVNCTNLDYIDRSNGDTTSTGANNVFSLATLADSKIDGLTLGLNGTISNCHPYGNYVNGQDSSNVKIRNFGSTSAFLPHGATSSLWPATVWNSATSCFDITLQRIFVGETRSATMINNSIMKSMLFETVYGRYSSAMPSYPANTLYKNIAATPPNSATSYAGYNFGSGFTSATAGWLQWHMATPSSLGSTYVTTSVAAGSGFSGSGNLRLKVVGDYAIFEFPYSIKGHTAFANSAPTISGTNAAANHSFEYALDTGSGYGSWKTASAANLSGETISAAGFKIKLRITCTVANSGNIITFVNFTTASTLSAQTSNLYDLDTSTLTFTGLVSGSEVRCYTGSDPATAVEIGGTESSGTSFSFTHSSGGTTGFIRIFALGYQPFNYDPYTYSSSDTYLLVQQVVDRNYVNP